MTMRHVKLSQWKDRGMMAPEKKGRRLRFLRPYLQRLESQYPRVEVGILPVSR